LEGCIRTSQVNYIYVYMYARTGNRPCVFRKEIMRVIVFGTKDWTDYNDLMRQVTLLIEDNKHFYPDDKEYVFVHKGMQGAENMITEYIGKTERFLRQKGYKIKEELVRDKSSFSDVTMIESDVSIALVFGDSPRNRQCMKVMDAMEIPYRYFVK